MRYEKMAWVKIRCIARRLADGRPVSPHVSGNYYCLSWCI
jgi:hypothetical protein